MTTPASGPAHAALLEAERLSRSSARRRTARAPWQAARELRPTSCCSTCSCPTSTASRSPRRLTAEPARPRPIVLTSSRDGADFGSLVERSGARGFVPKADLSGRRARSGSDVTSPAPRARSRSAVRRSRDRGAGARSASILLADHRRGPRPLGLRRRSVIGWSFIGTGLFAWWRRPDNRSGALMVAVGLRVVPERAEPLGLALALRGRPAQRRVVAGGAWSHLLLVFPDGRLETGSSARLVAAGYLVRRPSAAPVGSSSDRHGRRVSCEGCPENPLLITDEPDLYDAFNAVPGAARDRRAGRPGRRAGPRAGVALAAGSAAQAFARCVWPAAAVLLVLGAARGRRRRRSRQCVRSRLPGRAGPRFVAGARSRSSPGCCAAASRAPTRSASWSQRARAVPTAGARRCATRSPTRSATLARARLLGARARAATWTRTGRPVELPAQGSGAVRDVGRARRPRWRGDRPRRVAGRRARADARRSARRPRWRSRTSGSTPSCAPGSRSCARRAARIVEAGRRRAPAARARPPRRRAAAAGRAGAQPASWRAARLDQRPRRGARAARRGGRRARPRRPPSCASWRAASTPPCSPTAASAPPLDALGRPRARSRSSWTACPRSAWPPPVESAAYFVVAEALTNVARYAQAEPCRGRVDAGNGTLVVEVRDDGVGGADPERGSGLRGLADRVGCARRPPRVVRSEPRRRHDRCAARRSRARR